MSESENASVESVRGMIDFFLKRPILSSGCSALILILGLFAIPALPIAQYPTIAPPTVSVTATYTGASAEAVEASVTAPLEQAINRVQGLRYISSQSGSDGTSSIDCTFKLDRNLDQAATDVQNAINLIQSDLPSEVNLAGIRISKSSGSTVITVGFVSDDSRLNLTAITSFIENNVVNDLQRIPGVSAIRTFDERKFAMRLWLNPKRLADFGLTVDDVLVSLRAQNRQIAAGAVGAPPTTGHQLYEYGLQVAGRLRSVTEFEHIVLKTNPDGGFVRLHDVGRVTIGAASYADFLTFDGKPAVALGIQQFPNGNALEISRAVLATLERAKTKFPHGMRYQVGYDRSTFVRASIQEVVITLGIAVALVVLVILAFLKDWRITLVPAITIPISLIGTFFALRILGLSINTLTLFGLTLATGLVVDDAVVIVENITRFVREKNLPPLRAAREAMSEIQGAVVTSSLVLLAVFLPVAFYPGVTGALYRPFALTIACSITISLLNALTLTPILTAFLLRKHSTESRATRAFDRALQLVPHTYHLLLHGALQRTTLVLGIFIVGLFATAWAFMATPTGFIPKEDQGEFYVLVAGPSDYSIDQTRVLQGQVEALVRRQNEVAAIVDDEGQSFDGNASNLAILVVRLKPWGERPDDAHSAQNIIRRVNHDLAPLGNAEAFAIAPSEVPGIGSKGGYTFELEDRSGLSIGALERAAKGLMRIANDKDSGLSDVRSSFRTDKPSYAMDLNREKASQLGVPLALIEETLQVEFGSLYVNDFDIAGRSYRVYVQGDAPYRSHIADLEQTYVRGAALIGPAAMIPLSSFVRPRLIRGPQTITHFNLFRSIEISGETAPGFSTGQSIEKMQRLARSLPTGLDYEWSGIAREEVDNASERLRILFLSVIFVIFLLAVQYRSLLSPLIIILAAPLAILGALAGLWLRHSVSDVFAQIGYVMLVGLATKNAILIVEFANQLRSQGIELTRAVMQAMQKRLRPIMMTSIAFILGVTPLLFANGAGSSARHSLGTVVFYGMLMSTFLNLFITPALYVFLNRTSEWIGFRNREISSRDATVNENPSI